MQHVGENCTHLFCTQITLFSNLLVNNLSFFLNCYAPDGKPRKRVKGLNLEKEIGIEIEHINLI